MIAQNNIPDFRKLFDSAPDLYLVTSADLKIVAASEPYLKATMRERDELLGKALFEAFPDNPDDLTADGVSNLSASLSRVLKNKTPDKMPIQKYDIARPKEAGGGFEERFWSPLNTPLLNDKGEVEYIIHRVEDVTEFMRLKKRRTEDGFNEEVFRALVENIKDYAIFMIDKDGKVMSWNDGAKQIKGYTASEIIGKPISVFYTKEEIANDEPAYNLKMAKENGRYESEGWRVRKDGSLFWADVVFTTLYDEDGAVRGFAKVTRDITDRKKTDDRIIQLNKELEQRVIERTKSLNESLKEISDYKYALDEAAIVAITDQKGIIKHVNDNFCKISKYSAEELIGQDHRIINSGYHSKDFIRNIWVTIANGNIWKGELRNKAKDGTIYWVDTTIIPFLNEQEKPYQYVAIRSDITERKLAEEQILNLNNELEERVNLRTAQLESVNKELEAFSYSVSHDLRAPLRAISGFTQILKEDLTGKLTEEDERACDRIIYNTKKMGQLIDDLLSFSRLSRKELSKSTFSMTILANEAAKDLCQNKQHLKLEIDKLDDAPGDMGMIKQVWINLIGNALKYSGNRNEPVIKIGSEKKDKEIVYHVTDNGVGFDMKYADKLFGVFQRLHSEAEFEGTGVGLAIVKRVITRHGGTVFADSTVGEGATFYFTLPY